MEEDTTEINFDNKPNWEELETLAESLADNYNYNPMTTILNSDKKWNTSSSISNGFFAGSGSNTSVTKITNPIITKNDNLSEVLFQILKYADDADKFESILNSIEWENMHISEKDVAEWYEEKLSAYLIEFNRKKEQSRIEKIREVALAKLSDEEKKALGIELGIELKENWKDENQKDKIFNDIKKLNHLSA